MDALKEILRPHCFIIPANQRGYSWEKRHAKALVDDLSLMGDRSHYVGSIIVSSTGVVFKDDKTRENLTELLIDDGQQRLTTSLMLIHQMIARFDALGASKDQHRVDLDLLLHCTRGTRGLRIKNSNPHLDQALRALLLGDPMPKGRIPAMTRMELVHNYLGDLCTSWNLTELVQWKLRLTAGAKFILVDLEKEDIDRFLAFDAINSRGLELAEFDKVKNFCTLLCRRRTVLAKLKPEDCWYRSLQTLEQYGVNTRGEEAAFISEAYSIFFNEKIGLEVHNHFTTKFDRLLESDDSHLESQVKDFVNFWAEFAEAFGFIAQHEREATSPKKANQDALFWMRNIDHLGLVGIPRPILCACLLRFQKKDFAKAAWAMEIYTFRVHGLAGRRTDANKNPINHLAHHIAFKSLGLNEMLQQICSWLDRWARLDMCFQNLVNSDPKYPYDRRVKGWAHCYYFLYQYELSVSPKSVTPVTWKKRKIDRISSIEHILPQGHRDKGWWQKHWPDKNMPNAYKHRLGNLVLTDGNSVLGGKAFSLKLKDPSAAYSYTSSNATNGEKQIAKFTSGASWKKGAILKREAALVRFALTRWSLGCCNEDGSYKFPAEWEGKEAAISIKNAACIDSASGLADESSATESETDEEAIALGEESDLDENGQM